MNWQDNETVNDATRPDEKKFGTDGLFTLLLSTLVVIATLGLSLAWQMRRVVRVARAAPTDAQGDSAMVLGMRLRREAVAPDFAQRLLRAQRLYAAGRCRQVLIVGGVTGANSVSEAQRGREFLLARGVPARAILTEDRSRHTLENLRHARTLLGRPLPRLILITSRYHLARSATLAEGLQLPHTPCAAEDQLVISLTTLARLVIEAFHLHWYFVGKSWSTATRNRKSLERIT